MTAVPFFRPEIDDRDIAAVADTIRSGWLTTGPAVREFEVAFARYAGAANAVALNSCTAALHLALAGLGVRRGQRVLVPALTFAATAEVVRYFAATPTFVDVDRETLCMDPQAVSEELASSASREGEIIGAIPVHYAGQMAPMIDLASILRKAGCFVVEDAAHALPAAMLDCATARWLGVGALSDVACFSFYANKTITTGEGGMATTDSTKLADAIRLLSLHGMSGDGWKRYGSGGTWDYEIVAPGFKYNMSDILAALGVQQLARADEFRARRAAVAARYNEAFADVEEIEMPAERRDRLVAWHLYVIRLRTERLRIGRDEIIRDLGRRGIGTSVHWRPLHMQPYYRDRYGYRPEQFPVAFREWSRLISLPIFPGMREAEIEQVIATVREVVAHATRVQVVVA